MKVTLLTLSVFILTACSRPCLVCEVIKDGAVIERYQSCDDEGKEGSRKICEEMAKLQKCQCACKKTDKEEQ
jgi:major membrane immunogen (membrane-anchored lipoprotein)